MYSFRIHVVVNYYDEEEETHSRPENLKKSSKKNLLKSNKSISRNIFGSNSIFCYFKNGQKSIFVKGKSLKLPEMQFHGGKI